MFQISHPMHLAVRAGWRPSDHKHLKLRNVFSAEPVHRSQPSRVRQMADAIFIPLTALRFFIRTRDYASLVFAHVCPRLRVLALMLAFEEPISLLKVRPARRSSVIGRAP